MSSVVIAGDTSGTVTLSAPAVAGTTTLTLPSTSGTVVTDSATQTLTNKTLTGATITVASTAAPAFSAYLNATQSITLNTWTKLQCGTEEFDTNSNYDNTTNYRFTPTVAGYYQVNGCFGLQSSNANCYISIYKNGLSFKRGTFVVGAAGIVSSVSALVYLNGTTDYVELYGQTNTTQNAATGADQTYFQAAMIRSA